MRKDSSLKAEMPEGHKASEASGAGAAVVTRRAIPFVRFPVVLSCLESEDRTQQAFKDEANINFLMKRYEKTGILPQGRDVQPQYLDATQFDFVDAQNQVARVRGVFSQLDARTRARFSNDPAQMLDFLADPQNNAEAVKMGLMAKPKESDDGTGKATEGARGVGQARGADQGDGAAGSGASAAGVGAAAGAPASGAGGSGGDGQGR